VIRLPDLKRPSGFLPIVMSLSALATIAAVLATRGPAPQTDEGTAAHVWQLLMAGQVPFVLYFAVVRIPQSPRQSLPVLALQVAAALIAIAPVYFLHW
jgi:hypothetical protein